MTSQALISRIPSMLTANQEIVGWNCIIILIIGCYKDRTLDGISLRFNTNGRSSFSTDICSQNNIVQPVRWSDTPISMSKHAKFFVKEVVHLKAHVRQCLAVIWTKKKQNDRVDCCTKRWKQVEKQSHKNQTFVFRDEIRMEHFQRQIYTKWRPTDEKCRNNRY